MLLLHGAQVPWCCLCDEVTSVTADYDVVMDNTVADSEKEFAVIKFYADDTYSTCSQRNKAADSAEFFDGEEVTIQWSKHEVYKGMVVFTNGKEFKHIGPI